MRLPLFVFPFRHPTASHEIRRGVFFFVPTAEWQNGRCTEESESFRREDSARAEPEGCASIYATYPHAAADTERGQARSFEVKQNEGTERKMRNAASIQIKNKPVHPSWDNCSGARRDNRTRHRSFRQVGRIGVAYHWLLLLCKRQRLPWRMGTSGVVESYRANRLDLHAR